MLISLIIPCFNESEALPFLYETLIEIKNEIISSNKDKDFELIFVDDGSSDQTLATIKKFASKDASVKYISFSRNFGKEAAMYAGLLNSKGDYVAIMDADMQDPPSLLSQMIKTLDNDECDIIAARRVSRIGEPKIRSFFARCFYKIINKMCEVEIADGARDFRLMKRSVVNAILSVGERQRFSKGIFSWVGFRTKWIEHENVERVAGETKWSFWKLFKYAIDGIITFTVAPMRLATYAGITSAFGSFIYMIYYLIKAVISKVYNNVPGYPSLLCFILFIGGLILMALGILGEYIGKIYIEVKQRPIYIEKETNI